MFDKENDLSMHNSAQAERRVLFGAGRLGREIATLLKDQGRTPLAFCDNNQNLWGTEIEGIPVFSPAEASRRFKDAIFVVTIWHPSKVDDLKSRIHSLHSLGCERVTTFISFFLAYPERFRNRLFWSTRENIRAHERQVIAARELFDDEGRKEFDRQLRFRLGDELALEAPDPGRQYFPNDFVKLNDDEFFVDCGAFNGDTLADFLKECGGKFLNYFALEPEPKNRGELQQFARKSGYADRIEVFPYAVGATAETLRFSAAGISSEVSVDGELSIECVSLDSLLEGRSPTFIKMDIEGFELDALKGARETILRSRPKLAICVYHKPADLWEIPLWLSEQIPDSKFTLRSYMADGFDCVCFCQPMQL